MAEGLNAAPQQGGDRQGRAPQATYAADAVLAPGGLPT